MTRWLGVGWIIRIYKEAVGNPNVMIDVTTKLQHSLKRHIQSVHAKIKYSCNQCDHQATEKGSLK